MACLFVTADMPLASKTAEQKWLVDSGPSGGHQACVRVGSAGVLYKYNDSYNPCF